MLSLKKRLKSVSPIVIVSVLIAVLVGMGMFFWQSKKNRTEVRKIEEEKQDLQDEVQELKEDKKEFSEVYEYYDKKDNKVLGVGEKTDSNGQNIENETVFCDENCIILNSPQFGENVSSPVGISGQASVYEGTLNLRIKNAAGSTIAEDFATCNLGAPEWGNFNKILNYSISSPQQGTIEVYTTSVKDGSINNIVSIPVNLE